MFQYTPQENVEKRTKASAAPPDWKRSSANVQMSNRLWSAVKCVSEVKLQQNDCSLPSEDHNCHLVWREDKFGTTNLDRPLPVVQGKWSAPHFTSKARVMDYVKEKHPGLIGIFPSPSAFYTNFVDRAPPRRVIRHDIVNSAPRSFARS